MWDVVQTDNKLMIEISLKKLDQRESWQDKKNIVKDVQCNFLRNETNVYNYSLSFQQHKQLRLPERTWDRFIDHMYRSDETYSSVMVRMPFFSYTPLYNLESKHCI